jgi:hypothetical protein
MNDNVGEMPLDIFSDYVSDVLGEEWFLEYLIPILNYHRDSIIDPFTEGHGTNYNLGNCWGYILGWSEDHLALGYGFAHGYASYDNNYLAEGCGDNQHNFGNGFFHSSF